MIMVEARDVDLLDGMLKKRTMPMPREDGYEEFVTSGSIIPKHEVGLMKFIRKPILGKWKKEKSEGILTAMSEG